MRVCSLCCSGGLSLTCGMGGGKRGGRKETGFVLVTRSEQDMGCGV